MTLKILSAFIFIFLSHSIFKFLKNGVIPDLMGVEVSRNDDPTLFFLAITFAIAIDLLFAWGAFLM